MIDPERLRHRDLRDVPPLVDFRGRLRDPLDASALLPVLVQQPQDVAVAARLPGVERVAPPAMIARMSVRLAST